MAPPFERVAIVGATGPTGRALVRELTRRDTPVRAIARDTARLAAAFPYDPIERRVADARDPSSLAAALDGCDAVVDCIGLPGDRMKEHIATAGNLAEAIRAGKVRALMVSSYWSYMPITERPVSETHPRTGGPPWARMRREAEDMLRGAGAAVVHLPDFFGPHVHTSTLQHSLMDAVAGRRMNWIGKANVARDYIFVPDAMRITAELITREEASGEDWIVPGAGPLTGDDLATMLSDICDRRVRLRPAGLTMLRLVGLFDRELSGFLQVVPDYLKPISFDGAKLDRLIGAQPRTPYPEALAQTIRWLTET